MAEVKSTAPRFALQAGDFLKSLILGIGAPILYVVQEMIPGWDIPPIAKVAIAATVTYLLKNFFNGPSLIVHDPSKKMIEEAKEGNLEVVKKDV